MVRGIRGFRLLEGYRGHPPADIEALEETLLRVSRLAENVPEIGEIERNPVFAFPGRGVPDRRRPHPGPTRPVIRSGCGRMTGNRPGVRDAGR